MTRVTATYRLQLRGDMSLSRAAGLVPYLARLGVSHLYASPIFTATPGSTHGYDVTNFSEIDPAIGGLEAFHALSKVLKRHGLGLILDFVPNHMGASPYNPWWRDILEWGQESDYREHFDIDWSAPKLIVPALGEPYGEALQKGLFGLSLDERDGGIALSYYDLRLPLTPPSYARTSSPASRARRSPSWRAASRWHGRKPRRRRRRSWRGSRATPPSVR
jgi:(1->4)-alpha-D-glucan 1-alpha-D-glucosylmutase